MSPMTLPQQIITIALCVLATIITRFTPFLLFRSDRPIPPLVAYLGSALPSAVFAFLVIYCLKDVNVTAAPHGIPVAIAVIVTACVHLYRRNILLSMLAGTLCYMIFVQYVF